MLYLVSGSMISRELLSGPHEQFRDLVQKMVVPSIKMLTDLMGEGKLLAGGVRAGSPDVVLILELTGESHIMVRRQLHQLPIFPLYRWEVTPLESFEDWTKLFGS